MRKSIFAWCRFHTRVNIRFTTTNNTFATIPKKKCFARNGSLNPEGKGRGAFRKLRHALMLWRVIFDSVFIGGKPICHLQSVWMKAKIAEMKMFGVIAVFRVGN